MERHTGNTDAYSDSIPETISTTARLQKRLAWVNIFVLF